MAKMPLSRRVALARQHARLSLDELAARVSEITGATMAADEVRALEAGRAKLSARLVHLAIACGVRPEWLVLTEGPMQDDHPEVETESDDPISEQETRLLERWRLLPVDMRSHLLAVIERLGQPMDPSYRVFEIGAEAKKRGRRTG